MPNSQSSSRADAFAPAYRDAIALVADVVGDAHLTSLAGGNLAIEAPLEGGWLWVTDEDDALFGDRDSETGWSVGVYPGTDDSNPHHRDLVFLSAHGTDLAVLRRLLSTALREFARANSQRHR